MVTAALRWTGVGKLVGFYRHFAFAGPRTTTGIGVALLAGAAGIHLYWLIAGQAYASESEPPGWLIALFVVEAAGMLLATVGLVAGRMSAWVLGSLLATAMILVYVASRLWPLPGLPMLVGWWDDPLGNFGMILAATFLGVHFAVLTNVCVAHPHQRDWHD